MINSNDYSKLNTEATVKALESQSKTREVKSIFKIKNSIN